MAGETDLKKLLSSLEPVLNSGTYAFQTFADPPTEAVLNDAIVTVREDEGTTVVVPGDPGSSGVFAWITLTVHSSLDAVGLTAAVSRRLADEAIPCNVVAGFYHDHLFVPIERGADAIRALTGLRDVSTLP